MALTTDLRNLGLQTGDRVVLHSSLRSLGHVEGGAEKVVRALLEVLGDQGLLVAPAFTYCSLRFDPNGEPGLTGRIAETIRMWPGAVRSWHPTHSVAAIGTGAEELCERHHRLGGLDVDSPLDRLARDGGFVLLLGVGHAANSTVHVGEARLPVPYLDVPFGPDDARRATVVVEGEEIAVDLRNSPGCSRAFGAIERPLRACGAIRDGKVGGALTQLVRGEAVVETTMALLEDEPAALLCTDPRCYRCTESRKLVEAAR